jgi:hypothetical protein
VGPTDDGRSIILADKQSPMNNSWQKWLLGGILAAVAVIGAAVLWIVRHPRTASEAYTDRTASEAYTDSPIEGDDGPSLGEIIETPTSMDREVVSETSSSTLADPGQTMSGRR